MTRQREKYWSGAVGNGLLGDGGWSVRATGVLATLQRRAGDNALGGTCGAAAKAHFLFDLVVEREQVAVLVAAGAGIGDHGADLRMQVEQLLVG